MMILCVSGLLTLIWVTHGASVSYIYENLKFSTVSVQRIYEPQNFYWKILVKVENLGQVDAKITDIYVSGNESNSTEMPPPIKGFSIYFLPTKLASGSSNEIEILVDSGYSMAAFDKLTFSAYTDTGKIYDLNITLV